MQTVMADAFRKYGRVLPLDLQDFSNCIGERKPVAQGQVEYEPSVPEFEQLTVLSRLRDEVFGGMPGDIGHCSGWNNKLSGL